MFFSKSSVIATVETSGCDLGTPTVSESLSTVIAYPNPYNGTFKLKVVSNNTSTIQVKVYDMLGRLIEQRETGLDQIAQIEIGNGYPSGVYNVVVTQENNSKALHVIKK